MGYILYDSNYMPILVKGTTVETSKVINGCQEFQGREGGKDRQNTDFRAVKMLSMFLFSFDF